MAVTTQGFCDGKCSSAYQFGPTDLEWEEYIWVYPSSPLIKIRSDSWDHEQRCSWNPLWDKMLWLLRFGPMHGVVSGEAFPLHQDYSVRWLHSGGWVGWELAWLAQQCWSIQACTPLRNPVTWSYSRHDYQWLVLGGSHHKTRALRWWIRWTMKFLCLQMISQRADANS